MPRPTKSVERPAPRPRPLTMDIIVKLKDKQDGKCKVCSDPLTDGYATEWKSNARWPHLLCPRCKAEKHPLVETRRW